MTPEQKKGLMGLANEIEGLSLPLARNMLFSHLGGRENAGYCALGCMAKRMGLTEQAKDRGEISYGWIHEEALQKYGLTRGRCCQISEVNDALADSDRNAGVVWFLRKLVAAEGLVGSEHGALHANRYLHEMRQVQTQGSAS
jgi:hypothetical protein